MQQLRLLVVTLLPLVLAASASAWQAQNTADKFEQFLRPYVEMGDLSGNVLVARAGSTLLRKSYGKASYELNVNNNPNTKFHIASLSKTFTAAAILVLERQRKLKLTDTLDKYIGDFPPGRGITIEQLLTHSSGLPDYYTFPEYAELKRKSVTLDNLVALVRSKPLEFEPGTKSNYSNTGYDFLALIIERISGRSYGEFVQQELFAPLGMKDSGTWSDNEVLPDRAAGYQPWVPPSRLRNAPFYDKSILTGSGSLYSTIDDLYKWYQALRRRTLFDLASLKYPYGWGSRELDGHKFIEQSGRDPGFVSHLSAFMEDDVVIILLNNVEVAADEQIARGLADIALGKDVKPTAERRPPRSSVMKDSRAYVGRYQIGPQLVMDVKATDGNLFLRGPGGDFLPLDILDTDKFFFRQLYTNVDFVRDKNGKITQLLWNGQYPCPKVSDIPML